MNNDLLGRIVLGTASFGNEYGLLNKKKSIDISEARKIIKLFLDSGGLNIDTSPGYGRSEVILSKVLKEFNNKKINITTKFLLDEKYDIDKIKNQIDNSFKKFGNKLNTILCHTPDINKTKNADFVIELFKYIKNNYSINTGLSIYSKTELNNLSSTFKNEIQVIQAPYNIFDSTASSLKKDELISQNTIIVGRSIFLQGFLISDKCPIPEFYREFKSFRNICSDYGLDSKELCIRYAFQNKFIDLIAVGVNSLDHLTSLINKLKMIKNNKQIQIRNLDSEATDIRLIDPRRWPKS